MSATGVSIDAGRAPASRPWRRLYLPVRGKFALAFVIAAIWCALSVWLSLPWLSDLAHYVGRTFALAIVVFIAYVPGFMNAFLVTTILIDRRPRRQPLAEYPAVTILIACYNEEEHIEATLRSLALQDYPGPMEVLVLDDGSVDDTAAVAEATIETLDLPVRHDFRVVSLEENIGKAQTLNRGLAIASHEIIITIDGDSWVFDDAVCRLVERYSSDPKGTQAVAGAVAVRNSRDSWLSRAQEWDYFHGIAAVKRMQSIYHGTLVAQGAFSLYCRSALREIGGWPDGVGEDIVLSWALLERGHRIGYCEDAVLFTTVPEKLIAFARQRKRWSRGLIEAFKAHSRLLVKPRLSTLFIWWNALFLPLDVVYTFVFIPGIVLALFGHYAIVGIMTLAVLPLAAIINAFIFRVQRKMYKRQALKVRRNVGGLFIYLLAYSIVMQPVCVWGYVAELAGRRKTWGAS